MDTLLDGDQGRIGEGTLVSLYEKIQKKLSGLPGDKKNYVTIMIDDVSLMEVAANGASDFVLDFLHYCHALTSEFVRQSCNISFFLLIMSMVPLLLSIEATICCIPGLYIGHT